MPRTRASVVGIDVGGTKILLGYVGRNGEIYRSQRYPMDRGTQASVLASIDQAVASFLQCAWDGPAPLAIGIGVVGQTDPASGLWLQAINLPIHTPVPLAKRLYVRYGLPVAVDNDVHAATLAEMRLGVGLDVNDFVYINVGTGLSAGIVCNGQLVRGRANYAGELGHMVVEPDGELCSCGRRGCLEPIASGGGLIAQVQRRLADYPESLLHPAVRAGALTSKAIFEAADAGDALASAVAERALRGLNVALVNLVNLLNPEVIVLGGGVFSDRWLLPRLRTYIAYNALPAAYRACRGVVLSELEVDQVGLLGAATLAWERLGSSVS